MPHICTRCNSVFKSGEDILKGCPSCGWKKFMFMRKLPQGEDMPAAGEDQLITSAMGVRKPPKAERHVSSSIQPSRKEQSIGRSSIDGSDPDRSATDRSVVDRSAMNRSVPDRSTRGAALPPNHPGADHRSDDRQNKLLWPGEERALESVKITAPGTYELNLPSLFERDELIMAVKEGTYFIDLTSAFKKGKRD
ncbi:MAG: Zn-ribbon domain-containing protein [Methanothrix sp.]|jgi:predicted  nucleic acid-binding Zn-ribbon protein|uniref:Zn-ribbon domain-containing protein n=1 Tax=Methanothrix sp. TaxID=90426 RepID=UPI0025E4F694|nr:Zn-ribbon domain-containing protein [Methanothrix sp.]MBK7385480.1 Zn-ribbon domain-containing protein [Methanothrix sp.]HPW74198.1 Zn-ribbon domain-containing protein [Methanothrix sp.]